MNENISTVTQALNRDGYEYNHRNGCWEKENEMILIEKVKE